MLKVLLAALIGVSALWTSAAIAQNALPQAGINVQQDASGKGAVLCLWNIYVSTEAAASYCGFPKVAGDAAVANAIERIDAFIVANAKHPPYTREQIDEAQQRLTAAVADSAKRLGGKEKFCSNASLQQNQSFRLATPAQTKALVDNALSIPREPLMNPCI